MPAGRQATSQYKGNRNLSGSCEKSAGFIVPLEDQGQHNPVRGKGPCFSQRSSTQVRRIRLPYG
jgi:hypothetical protein